MSNYIGKHILLDCYGCENTALSSEGELLNLVSTISKTAGFTIKDSFFYEGEDEVTLAAFGQRTHICIHVYPSMRYVAADIYCFNSKLKPTEAIHILKNIIHPDKIRATSIRRGDFEGYPDMKPKTKSKTTTMRKVKFTKTKFDKMVHFFKNKAGKKAKKQ